MASANPIVEKFSEQVTKRVLGSGIGPGNPPQDLLYHYTPAEGAHGIIKANEIWATNYNYLNDSTEFLYAKNIFQKVINERLSECSQPAKAILEALLKTPNCGFDCADLFVSCFCEGDDLLSQWRGYGARGGYSIGFRAILEEQNHGHFAFAHHSANKTYALTKVRYEEERRLDLVRFLVDEFREALSALATNHPLDPGAISDPIVQTSYAHDKVKVESPLPPQYQPLFAAFYDQMVTIAPSFKNNKFSEEKEWRLTLPALKADGFFHPDMEFRVHNGALVPYVRLPLYLAGHHPGSPRRSRASAMGTGSGNFEIVKIRYGPNLHGESTRNSIALMVAKYLPGSNVEILGSEIPIKA